jgi:ribosomal protein L39E
MSKKSGIKKRMLGKANRKSGRIPLLTAMRTHRKIRTNKLSRDWRRSKLRIKVE